MLDYQEAYVTALVISLSFITVPTLVHVAPNVFDPPVKIWMALLYLALISLLGGFFWWNKGLVRVSQTLLR